MIITIAKIVIYASLFLLAGCFSQEKVVCDAYGDKSFHEALKLQLKKQNIKITTNKHGFICAKESQALKVNEIAHMVNEYYRGLAVILTTPKEESSVMAWVNSNKIPHDKKKVKNGLFLVVYSMTEEIAKQNRKKLNEILRQ